MNDTLSRQRLRETFAGAQDIVEKKIALGPDGERTSVIFYTVGLADKHFVNEQIVSTLLHHGAAIAAKGEAREALLLFPGRAVPLTSHQQAVDGVLAGSTVLLFDGMDGGLLIESMGVASRPPQEPDSEGVVRGPHDGFTESLEVNLGLLRRRVRDPGLQVEFLHRGARSKTTLAIVWIKGLPAPKVVDDVRSRLNQVNVDAILDSGYLEHWLKDQWWTPFPTVQNSARPDRLVAALMEGRVLIMADTSNTALVVPTVLANLFTVPEDYYYNFYVGTFLRLLRSLAFWMSLYLPSLYVALVGLHPELLPLPMMLALTDAREAIPLPIFVEALFMEMTIELLREAGLRLPKPIGQTIGIVGGIIIGDAAVNAGIVSPVMVLVVALTAVASFTIPDYQMGWSIRIIRFPMMLLTAMFGLFGIMVGSVLLLYHLVGLSCAGVPYMAPYAPIRTADLKDSGFLRLPLPYLKRRPSFLSRRR